MTQPTQQALSLTDNQTDTGTVDLFDGTGASIPTPAGTTGSYTSSNPAVVTVTTAADGLSPVVTAVAVGSAQITGSVTVPGLSAPLSVVSPVAVVTSAAAGLVIQWGTPTAVVATPAPAPAAAAPVSAAPAAPAA